MKDKVTTVFALIAFFFILMFGFVTTGIVLIGVTFLAIISCLTSSR